MHTIPFIKAFAIHCVVALRVQDEWIAKMDARPEAQRDAYWQAFKARPRYQLVFK